ncbi:MAG: glycerol-3-phosphate acyltransferase [Candidatus Saccharibacteria bacterium]|nr:glycerol-3-phosphate acyltransferase [Candidatus Saccharibacteria bacterium]
MIIVVAVIMAYVLGSVPFGKIIARIAGIDIQKRGSGNIGFANMLRVLGWKYALPTLLLDVAKGFCATAIGMYGAGDMVGAFLIGYIAIIGHCFPVWLGFRGGKGIATGLGVVLFLNPLAGLAAMIVYGIALFGLKVKSAVASLLGSGVVIVIWVTLFPETLWMPVILVITAGFTLRDNIMGKVPNYG